MPSRSTRESSSSRSSRSTDLSPPRSNPLRVARRRPAGGGGARLSASPPDPRQSDRNTLKFTDAGEVHVETGGADGGKVSRFGARPGPWHRPRASRRPSSRSSIRLMELRPVPASAWPSAAVLPGRWEAISRWRASPDEEVSSTFVLPLDCRAASAPLSPSSRKMLSEGDPRTAQRGRTIRQSHHCFRRCSPATDTASSPPRALRPRR